MSRGNGRACPVCSTAGKPVFRALCRLCWQELPEPIAVRHHRAWKARIREPGQYGESLIAIYQWRQHRRGT